MFQKELIDLVYYKFVGFIFILVFHGATSFLLIGAITVPLQYLYPIYQYIANLTESIVTTCLYLSGYSFKMRSTLDLINSVWPGAEPQQDPIIFGPSFKYLEMVLSNDWLFTFSSILPSGSGSDKPRLG